VKQTKIIRVIKYKAQKIYSIIIIIIMFLRVRRVSCSLILKMNLVPPSLLRLSFVPSSFWSIS